ncbi:Prominin domain containing protein, partial [Asbolus verrucosus]
SISHALDSPTSIPCVQTPNSRTADKKIRFENITKISARISGLEFLDVPKGDEMRIHNLRLEEQYLLFEVFSSLMGYLQLGEFPTDVTYDVQNYLLKTEIAVLVWILLWTILALSVPFVLAIHLCYSNNSIRRLNEDTSDASADFREKCVERTLGFLLHFFLLLLLAPIASIFVANEQISRQMSRSEAVANIIFEDLNTFVRNTHMQMFFVATSSTDATVEAIGKDLEDVEKLLGSSFQEELARETGIDIAFDALDELRLGMSVVLSICRYYGVFFAANGEVTSLVANLLHECDLASAAAKLLGERLKEVSRQLTIARQQCRREDRALCYTLQYTGLEVTFSCE